MTTANRPTKQEIYADKSRKPEVLPFVPAGIPRLLTMCPRWVLWRLKWKVNARGDGKWDKPLYRTDGRPAKSNTSSTWATFDRALRAYQRGGFDGCGFVLGDGWTGLDLDDVRDRDTGAIVYPWAEELIRSAGGYADVSPSGTGVKLIGNGNWVLGKNAARNHPEGGKVEVHIRQYFTLTGRPA